MADFSTVPRLSGDGARASARTLARTPGGEPSSVAPWIRADGVDPPPPPMTAGLKRARAARFQPLLVIGMCVAYLPTALEDATDRRWILVAGVLLAGAGLWAWTWLMRRSRAQRDIGRLALVLALIGQVGQAVMVGVATPGVASRLLPVAVLLVAVHALMPTRWLRSSLQATTVVLALVPFVASEAATSELLLVLGLLLIVAWTVNTFAGDLISARRAARVARSRAQHQTALLFAVQDLPADDVLSAEAAVTALLAEQDLEVVGTGSPPPTSGGEPAPAAGDLHLEDQTTVVPLAHPSREDAALVVRRRAGGPLTATERALAEVAAAHLGAVRVNTARMERQHELLRQLTTLERTRSSFLTTVSDDLIVPLAKVRETAQRLGGPHETTSQAAGQGPSRTSGSSAPLRPRDDLLELTRVAELLGETVEALFALAQAQRAGGAEQQPLCLDAAVEELVASGVTVIGDVPDRTLLAVPELLDRGLRLWVTAPAALRLDLRPDALCLRREPPCHGEVETGLIGRLLVTAGGHWCAPGTVAFSLSNLEQRTWD